MPTKEEMLKVIYEEVADKTLSFGCKFIWVDCASIKYKFTYSDCFIIDWQFNQIKSLLDDSIFWLNKIIWHPIYPHHILQRWHKNKIEIFIDYHWEIYGNTWKYNFWNIYRDLTKDLEWQSEEVIKALFNLVMEVKWKN